MSQTPDATPGDPFGGFDLGAVLQQAQAMQAQLVQAQEELAETTVQGTSGGVTVTLDGTGNLVGVTIPPGTATAGDDESWTDLGDLVVAAYRDAKTQADDLAAQAMGPLAGGGGGGFDLGGMFGGGGDALPGGGDPRRPSGF